MATELAIIDRPEQMSRRLTLEPNTLDEALRFSDIVASSDLAPKDYRGKPANVLVAIQFGKELGVPPMQALQGVAVINGRPSVWGDLMWALVTNHPQFEDAIETEGPEFAEVTLKRTGRTPKTVRFTKQDAMTAGLWGKQGPWTQYPKRQMLWRARTFVARDMFPDALKGLVSVEEVGDYNDGPTIEGTRPQAETATTRVEPAVKISQDAAREFGKAWKASGYTMDDAKAFLASRLNISASLDITTDKYELAMQWAKREGEFALKAPSEPTQLQKEIAAAFDILGWNDKEQARFADQYAGDGAKILAELNILVDKRENRE